MPNITSSPNWQPNATRTMLKERAKYLAQIREFFTARQVLEVYTPLLCRATVPDPQVDGIPATYIESGSSQPETCYLQTSPEYAMKRLLAAGSGAIFQICKAFRQGEQGRYHNPEFMMLEWYRPGFDHHKLMDEMDELLQLILNCGAADRFSYAELFSHYLTINPHTADIAQLKDCAHSQEIIGVSSEDKNVWLNLLMSHCIEPQLGKERPVFIYDFPASQAALAKIRHQENPPVASRFEVYFKGIELANGFHELQDAQEQLQRFQNEIIHRRSLGLPDIAVDENFLAALQAGLPDCAGVALGVDRLIMLATECERLAQVLSFAFERV